MENPLAAESANQPAALEYRVHDGKVESRTLDGRFAHDEDWTQLSLEQLSSHVLCNTAVARWLERNLGWRRLLRACVGQEPNDQEPAAMNGDHRVQVCH